MFNSIWGGIKSAATAVYNTVNSIGRGIVSAFGGGGNQSANVLSGSYIPGSYTGQGYNQIPSYATPAPRTSSAVYGPAQPTSIRSGVSSGSGSSGGSNYSSASYNGSGYTGGGYIQPTVSMKSDAGQMGSQPMTSLPSSPSGNLTPGSATSGSIAGGANPNTGLFENTSVSNTTGVKTAKDDAQQPEIKTETQKLIDLMKPQPNLQELQLRAERETGLMQAKQQQANTQNQINAVTSKMNQDLLSLRATGSREGVTEAVYGGQQAEISREATIKLLPLQAQLAVDQNNLQLAQEHTDSLFKMYADDAKNSVDLYNKQVELYINDLTASEKKKADEILWQKNFNADMVKTEASNQADMAKEMLKTGNMSAYRAITGVRIPTNVNSPTFAQDYANYQKDLNSAVVKYGNSTQTNATYSPGVNPIVDSWASRIQAGSAKLTDIPASQAQLRNQVIVALDAMGNSPSGKPTTTEMGRAALITAKDLLNRFDTLTSSKKGVPVGIGGVFGTLPGTAQRDFSIAFDTLKDQLALDGIKYLKGQGQVSDAERALLKSAVSSLNRKQTTTDFRSTLQKIVNRLETGSEESTKTEEQIMIDMGYTQEQINQLKGN